MDDKDAPLNWVRVDPIRPECKFYLRQVLPPAPSLAMQGYDKGDMHRY